MFDIKKKNKIVKMIKDSLTNIEIDTEILSDDILKENVDFVITKKIKAIDSFDLDLNLGDYCLFLFMDADSYEESIKIIDKKLDENFSLSITEPETINIFFIFKTLKEQLVFLNSMSNKKLKDFIKNKMKKIYNTIIISAKNIDCNFLICGDCYEENFKINILSRIRSLDINKVIPIDNNNLIVKGYVFSAKLFDIIEIYNKLGSELFNYNVRCSIKDELEVDKKIKYTLKNDPDSFWFLNNGITLVIDDNNLNLKKDKLLELFYNDKSILSVINGAQTISTSAEYFYDSASQNLDIAKDKAEVMFRVIQVSVESSIDREQYQDIAIQEINKISIALNRQKPIKPEDVAYTVPFIYNINKLKENSMEDKILFSLVRRGEQNGYDLVTFFRIIKAYLEQKPGQALNDGSKKLLEVKEDEDGEAYFSNAIFTNIIQLEKQEITKKIFQKYFTPVNFVKQLGDEFIAIRRSLIRAIDSNIEDIAEVLNNGKVEGEELTAKKRLELEGKKSELEMKRAISNYGKWYFVAYVVYMLNNKETEDFTNFNASMKGDDLESVIEEFTDLFTQVTRKSLSSNLSLSNFKNEELYYNFRDYNDDKDVVLMGKINKYSNEKLTNFFIN